MRVSITIANYSWPAGGTGTAAELRRVVRAADEAGVDTVWVPDHLYQADPGLAPEDDMLEAYTTLGFIAAETERVRLGTMVAGVMHRPPALLVKAVTTLDVLSGGRAWLGIGAGYNEDEARRMGLPFPPTAERFERLEETLRLAKQMWSSDDSAFAGKHYQLGHPVNNPNSVRRPHPPILIGGTGERKTLPLVVEYGDACNLFDIPDGGQTVRRKLAVLAELCEAAGRPVQEIEKTLSARVDRDVTPEEFAERCQGFAELGIEHLVLLADGPWTEEAIASVTAVATRA